MFDFGSLAELFKAKEGMGLLAAQQSSPAPAPMGPPTQLQGMFQQGGGMAGQLQNLGLGGGPSSQMSPGMNMQPAYNQPGQMTDQQMLEQELALQEQDDALQQGTPTGGFDMKKAGAAFAKAAGGMGGDSIKAPALQTFSHQYTAPVMPAATQAQPSASNYMEILKKMAAGHYGR
jgi:hypothetical protein